MNSSYEIANQIQGIAQKLESKGYLSATDGNISLRVDHDTIGITPSGIEKSQLRPEDLAIVRLDGTVIKGQPSSELQMHLAVFRAASHAKAVVHAHPPYAIAWTIAFPHDKELPSQCLSEMILAAGKIPIVPYSRPGTSEMGEALIPLLPQHRALILARHGVLSWGEDLKEAARGVDRIEHCAKILSITKSMADLSCLDPEEVEYLKMKREEIGERLL